MYIHSLYFFIWFIKHHGLRDTFYSITPWNSTKYLKLGTSIATVIFPFKVYSTLTVCIVLYTTWICLVHVEEGWNIFLTYVHLLCNNVSLYSKNARFLAILLQHPAAILFTRHVGKNILYVYYKTNVCQTHNIKRLTNMIMFKILFLAYNL